MFVILSVAVIFVAIDTIKIKSSLKDRLEEIGILLFIYVFFGSILMLIFESCLGDLPYPDHEEYRIIKAVPIVSLKLKKENTASFILGTGEIRGSSYYKFYKTTDHGNLQFTKVPASNIEFIRSDTEPPQLVTYQKIYTYAIPWKIFIKGEEEATNDTYNVLIIPANAIEVKFDANL